MTVRIVHGINEDHFDLKGKSVGSVAKSLQQVFNIPHNAIALVGGQKVTFDYILSAGESVEFIKENGRKGGLNDFWSEAELSRLFGSESLETMKQNGFKLKSHLAATADEVISWQQWLMDRSTEQKISIPVQVDIDSGTITVQGVQYEIDQQLAAVVQCLLDAKGECRSTTQMKKIYPDHIFDERLDIIISRKLKKHKSGIGEFLRSDKRGYQLIWKELE
tara:strand:+ start:15121 stop:15780 length:660 start_codon:yes stop_codon:yes gene_type:complete